MKQNQKINWVVPGALLLAWLLIAAACGSDGNENSADVQQADEIDATHEAAEADTTVASGFDCEPLTDAQRSANDSSLHSDEDPGCRDDANRDFNETRSIEYRIKKRQSYPEGVVANPEVCRNPDSQVLGMNAVELEDNVEEAGDDIYALYLVGEILSFHEPQFLQAAVSELDPELTVTAIGDSVLTPGLGAIASEFDPASLTDPLSLQRFKIDAEFQPGADPLVDPLVLANNLLLLDPPVFARPNYVFTLAPGAQHSPANQPVPANSADLLNTGQDVDPKLSSAIVLDSDFNATSDPMTLWAGHMTFVSGVINQLAPGHPVDEVSFTAGTDFDESTVNEDLLHDGPMISDWHLLLTVLEIGSDHEVLNLSAGAYSCADPRDDGSLEPHHVAPPGVLEAAQVLNANGVVLVAAAGNDDRGTDRGEEFWPAALSDSQLPVAPTSDQTEMVLGDLIIGVRAIDAEGQLAVFTNTLPDAAVCALGVDVRSAFPQGTYEYDTGALGRFDGAAIWSGTSFAAPHVTAELLSRLAKEADVTVRRDNAVATVTELKAELFACP